MATTTTTVQVDPKKKEGDKPCCPPFSDARRASLDEKEVVWKDKPFVKESTWCFFHIPLNFAGAVKRASTKIDAAKADVPDEEIIVLGDMCSPWSTRIYFNVSKDDVPGAEMVKLSGTYLTKVFEGPFKDFNKVRISVVLSDENISSISLELSHHSLFVFSCNPRFETTVDQGYESFCPQGKRRHFQCRLM